MKHKLIVRLPLFLEFIALLLFCFACKHAALNKKIPDGRTQQYLLKKKFAQWQADAIKASLFWANDSCDMSFFEEGTIIAPDGNTYTQKEWLKDPSHYLPKNTDYDDWGFDAPTDKSYKYSYTDLNADGRLDQLVFFWPKHCDSSNGASWETVAVLFVSSGDDFIINTFVSEDNDSYGAGFYMPSKIDSGMIMGSIIKFAHEDPMCCPSISKDVVLDYPSWKQTYGENTLEKYMKNR